MCTFPCHGIQLLRLFKTRPCHILLFLGESFLFVFLQKNFVFMVTCNPPVNLKQILRFQQLLNTHTFIARKQHKLMFDKKKGCRQSRKEINNGYMFVKFMHSKILGIIDFITCHFLTKEICDVIPLISFNINRLGITEGDH